MFRNSLIRYYKTLWLYHQDLVAFHRALNKDKEALQQWHEELTKRECLFQENRNG